MARVPGREAIYDAAQRWKENCLIRDGSVFDAGAVWTKAHADQLDEYFVRQPAAPGDTFEAKLERQLAPSAAGAKQLMAEMLWVMMLMPIPAAFAPATKSRLIRRVWSWSGTELPERAPELEAPLRDGLANTGAGFNTNRPDELTFFVGVARALKAQPAQHRPALLKDPWGASEWMSGVQGAARPQMRHVLLHLLFPDSFEPTASSGQRRQFLAAFGSKLSQDEGLRTTSPDTLTAEDQRLLAIRQAFEAEHPGEFVNYYVSPWRERWETPTPARPRPPDPPDGPPSVAPPRAVREGRPGPRAWVIGAGEGAARWVAFRDGGHVAIGWDEIGDFRQYADQAALQAAVKAALRREWEPTNDALACHQFCREMAVGDEVFVKQGRDRILGYGVVAGAYEYDASRPDYRNVRRVDWRNEGDWTVPEELRFPTKTLTEVTGFRALLEHLRPLVRQPKAPAPPSEAPYTTDDALTEGVFLDRAEFERILAALRRRKNVILQGAPGVGKSFVARRLAYALIGHKRRDAVQGVQFHQSYAYEDFVQGWRPTEGGGFALRNGVFYEFCRRAQARPGEWHVFIIDEINRGNLGKILGELMLLIEADKRGPEFAIPLTYATSGDDTFHVPDNLFILGLMNTADRSLAMVDYALRRRFAFLTLEPRFASPAFREALRACGVDDATVDMIVQRVGAVNAEITADAKNLGRGFEVGHSYFVPTEHVPDPAAWYRRVVDDEVRPLLEEYWFDDAARVARCASLLLP